MKKITLLAFALFCSAMHAQYGGLDPSFGVNGIATTDINPATLQSGWARGGCVQADGKIVIAGSAYQSGTFDDFALTRFTEDGALDTSFGNNGVAVFDFQNKWNMFNDVQQLPDGRLAAVGFNYAGSSNDLVVAILNANGSLDTSVGTGGLVIMGSSARTELAYQLLVLDDGKLLISGVNYPNGSVAHYFCLFKLNADFTPDSSFGPNGMKIYTDYGNGDVTSISVQDDGSIICASGNQIVSTGTWFDFLVFKLDASGEFDPSFGSNGVVRVNITGMLAQTDVATCHFVQDDGKIVVAGRTWLNQNSNLFSVTRLNADGSVDETFGNNGMNYFDYGAGTNDNPMKILQRMNGKYVLAGGSDHGATSDFGLLFLNEDGTADTTFGNGGLVTTNIQALDFIYNIVERADGKIVAMGESGNFSGAGYTAARYTVEDNLGAGTQPLDAVSYYPNPASSELYVHARELSDVSFALTDVTGRKLGIVSHDLGNGEFRLSGLDALPTGTYIVRLTSDSGSRSWKILH